MCVCVEWFLFKADFKFNFTCSRYCVCNYLFEVDFSFTYSCRSIVCLELFLFEVHLTHSSLCAWNGFSLKLSWLFGKGVRCCDRSCEWDLPKSHDQANHIHDRVRTFFEGLWKFGENGISFSRPWKSVKTEWCLCKFVNLWSSEKAREKLSAYQSETAFPKTKQ